MTKMLTLFLTALLCSLPAQADSREARHRDALHRAVKSGAVMPLHEILEQVRGRFGDDVLGVEIEFDDDTWIYEFKLVSQNGRLLEVYVDASTGQVLEVENEE